MEIANVKELAGAHRAAGIAKVALTDIGMALPSRNT
jgi:hypothetical protein